MLAAARVLQCVFVALLIGQSCPLIAQGRAPAAAPEARQPKLTTTADHTKFKDLQKEFKSGPEARSGEAYDTVKLLRTEVRADFIDADPTFNADGSFTMKQR